MDKDWQAEVERTDAEFLREMGIRPAVIDDPFGVPPILPYPDEPNISLSKNDQSLLKAMAVAWPGRGSLTKKAKHRPTEEVAGWLFGDSVRREPEVGA